MNHPLPSHRPLVYMQVSVPAVGSFPLSVEGDYVYIEEVTFGGAGSFFPDALTLKPEGVNVGYPIKTRDRAYEVPGGFRSLEITNTNGAVALVGLYVGFGRLQKDVSYGSGRLAPPVFIRPANTTPYAVGDVVGPDPAAMSTFTDLSRGVGRMFTITGALLHKGSATLAGANFRLYLWSASASFAAIADNEPFVMDGFRGIGLKAVIEFPEFITGAAGSSWSVCSVSGLSIPVQLDGSDVDLIGQLVALDAYVPVSGEVFNIDLAVDQY